MNSFFEVTDIFGRWDDDLKSIGVAFEVAPKREFCSGHIVVGWWLWVKRRLKKEAKKKRT